MDWLVRNDKDGWATCSLTQAGLVRILSTPAFDAGAPSPAKVIELLKTSTESDPHHQFWTDTFPLTAISPTLRNRIRGHKQVTDAYLLAFAADHQAKVVTFDSRMRSLAPEGSAEYDTLVILPG